MLSKFIVIVGLTWLLPNCSHISFLNSEEQSDLDTRSHHPIPHLDKKKTTTKQAAQDFQVAKLQAELTELKNEQTELKARLKLIERGLVLGIAPDEITKDYARDLSSETGTDFLQFSESQARVFDSGGEKLGRDDVDFEISDASRIDQDNLASPSPSQGQENTPEVKEKKQATESPTSYLADLAASQDAFASGSYGKAISLFEQLSLSYPSETAQGNHLYWIGLCWMNLKEYEQAKKSFNSLASIHPNNPWVPRSLVHLSQIELRQGLPEQAISRLRKVIQQFPNEDAGEMAKAEISRYEQNL